MNCYKTAILTSLFAFSLGTNIAHAQKIEVFSYAFDPPLDITGVEAEFDEAFAKLEARFRRISLQKALKAKQKAEREALKVKQKQEREALNGK